MLHPTTAYVDNVKRPSCQLLMPIHQHLARSHRPTSGRCTTPQRRRLTSTKLYGRITSTTGILLQRILYQSSPRPHTNSYGGTYIIKKHPIICTTVHIARFKIADPF